MKETTRQYRATKRQMIRELRAARKIARLQNSGKPLAARTWLAAAGVPDATAHRYSGAFSRGVKADVTGKTRIKMGGKRLRKTVPVKLYTQTTFASRLAAYRPKNPKDAAVFETAATSM